MRRRDFLAGLGGAAVLGPRGASGQQAAMPVIGVLCGTRFDQGELAACAKVSPKWAMSKATTS